MKFHQTRDCNRSTQKSVNNFVNVNLREREREVFTSRPCVRLLIIFWRFSSFVNHTHLLKFVVVAGANAQKSSFYYFFKEIQTVVNL